jgi:uncharacterized protein (DUF111 family)
MVMNIINLGEKEDRVLNIVKAKYGLKNKNEAVAILVKIYTENFLEPELKPEYLEKLKRIRKEKGIPFKNIEELRKITGG